MNLPDVARYIKSFHDYVETFRQGSPEDRSCIDQKHTHSLRVLELAKPIIRSLNLVPACSRAALLAALFHDVGRFPQYTRYKTFLDRQSENHGLLGAKTLRRKRLLDGIDCAEQKIITGSVLLHNRRHIPASVSEEVHMLTNIVRDADKLDILSFIVSYFDPASDQNPAKTMNLKPHPTAYTETIYDHIMAGRLGTYEDMQWVNDFKMTLCSWVYDFNFSASRRLCIEQGYMEALIRTLPETRAMKTLGKKIWGALNNENFYEELKN